MFECARCGAVCPERLAFCGRCGGFSTFNMVSTRPADTLWSSDDVRSAAELLKSGGSTKASVVYPTLRFGKESLIAVYGPPGAGKSTFAARWLDGVPGSVLLVGIEEGFSEAMLARLRRLEIIREDFYVIAAVSIDGLSSAIEKFEPRAVVIDSLSASTLSMADLRRLTKTVGIPVLCTLHVNGEGDVAGPVRVVHEADVVIRVEALRWRLEKSRYSGVVEGEV